MPRLFTGQARRRLRRALPTWKKLFFALALVVGLLALTEGTLRILFRYDTEAREGPPFANGDGYRDRPHELAKPPGTVRLLCIGDSVTYGQGLEFEDSWPHLLERAMTRKCGGRYESILVARKGWNTAHKLEGLRNALAYQPDVVVYQYDLNDIDWDFPNIDPTVFDLITAVLFRTTPTLVKTWKMATMFGLGPRWSNRDWAVRGLLQAYSEQNPEWRRTEEAFDEIAALSRSRGFIPYFVQMDFTAVAYDPAYDYFRLLEFVRARAERSGLQTWPLHQLIHDQRPERFRLSYIDLHPNAAANQAAVERMAELADGCWRPD